MEITPAAQVEEYMKGRGLEYLYFSVHDDDIDGNQQMPAKSICVSLCVTKWYSTSTTTAVDCIRVCLNCLCLCVYLDHTRCNAWVLDGDLYHKGLQGVAVPVDSIESTVLLITVDMSRPWNTLDSLQKWAAVAREHIDKLRVAPEKLRELEHRGESRRQQSGS